MLAPWKKSYDKPRKHIKKQRHYFTNKDPSSQSYGFSNSHVGYESWTIMKAEHGKICASKLQFWRRLLRVPWTARRSNQSILKETSPEYSLKDWCWSSNTLATWFEELTHWKRPYCWERLKAGEEGDDSWTASPTQRTWASVNSRSWWWTGKASMLQSMRSQRIGHNWATELNWTELNWGTSNIKTSWFVLSFF